MEMISLAVYTAVIYYGIIRLKPDVALCWFSEHVYGVTLITWQGVTSRAGNGEAKRFRRNKNGERHEIKSAFIQASPTLSHSQKVPWLEKRLLFAPRWQRVTHAASQCTG